jgi:hypothetical protein
MDKSRKRIPIPGLRFSPKALTGLIHCTWPARRHSFSSTTKQRVSLVPTASGSSVRTKMPSAEMFVMAAYRKVSSLAQSTDQVTFIDTSKRSWRRRSRPSGAEDSVRRGGGASEGALLLLGSSFPAVICHS